MDNKEGTQCTEDDTVCIALKESLSNLEETVVVEITEKKQRIEVARDELVNVLETIKE